MVIRHQYSTTDFSGNGAAAVLTSTTEYPDGRFDWSVNMKVNTPDRYRERTFILERMPNKYLVLLAAIQEQLQSSAIGILNA